MSSLIICRRQKIAIDYTSMRVYHNNVCTCRVMDGTDQQDLVDLQSEHTSRDFSQFRGNPVTVFTIWEQ